MKKVLKFFLLQVNKFLSVFGYMLYIKRTDLGYGYSDLEYDYSYNSIAHNSSEQMNNRFNDKNFIKKYITNKKSLYNRLINICDNLEVELKDLDIADVGCGPGLFTYELKKHFPKNNFWGIDFSEAAIRYAKENFEDINFITHNIYKKIPHKFQLIICSQTLEHLDKPSLAISNLMDSLEKDGFLILSVPDGRRDIYKGHINFWSPESWNIYLDGILNGNVIKTGVIPTRDGNLYAIIKKS